MTGVVIGKVIAENYLFLLTPLPSFQQGLLEPSARDGNQ